MTSRSAVDAFLAHPALALAGASRSGKKFGNIALRELRARGYCVYPIHPAADVVDGVRCYRSVASLPEPVAAAVVVLPPKQGLPFIREAAGAGVHHVWLQQGAESADVLEGCRSLNLDVVSGECILMFAEPAGIHKFHRWIWRALGKLPA